MVMSTDNPDALFHPHLILDILPHPGRSPKKTTKTNTERKETKEKKNDTQIDKYRSNNRYRWIFYWIPINPQSQGTITEQKKE